LREVEKYPSIVGCETGTLALIANVLTNFAENKKKDDDDLRNTWRRTLIENSKQLNINWQDTGRNSHRSK